MGAQFQWRRIYKKVSTSKKLSLVHPYSALLWTWMNLHADDWGRLPGDPEDIKYLVVPRIRPFTVKRVEKCLAELVEAGLIVVYKNEDHGDRLFIEIGQFKTHQPPGNGKKRTAPEYPDISQQMYFNGSRWKAMEKPGRGEERRIDKKREEENEEESIIVGRTRSGGHGPAEHAVPALLPEWIEIWRTNHPDVDVDAVIAQATERAEALIRLGRTHLTDPVTYRHWLAKRISDAEEALG